nr:efflux RND transporter permease subunit [Chroococcidiopsis sp. CCMEE 29]
MLADFFIKRPVFAIVCSLIILLVGVISIPTLPVAQYPDVSPVQIVVSANYPGASAQVVEETVTIVLEQQINGVEGMRYINSTSSNDGTSTIIVTFKQGYDKDIAAVDVQNRVSITEPRLPEPVRQAGVSVTKQSSNSILGIALYGEKEGEYDDVFISNYADLYVLDRIKRIEGVGALRYYGERRYAVRVWLDPMRLASRNLTAQDVVDALNNQNLQVGVGRIGQPPAPKGQMYQIDLQVRGRLKEPTEFEEIVLKADEKGSLVKIKDVGRVELGAENYNSFARFNNRNAVGYEIYQIPGSNSLAVANAVKAELKQLAKKFPPGLAYGIPYDPTLFVIESRNEVISTLFQSIVLVVIIIFIFLQDWRTSFITAITIPISLIGTFAFIKAFGFSINSLTLFGLILATGMVVDNAIIVVEDVTRLIQDQRMTSRQATATAMHELFGAVIAGSLVLMAVFVPVAFFPGTAGQLYKQIALTIAFSIVISTFLALTLTPALSALMLQQEQKIPRLLGRIFAQINWLIDLMRQGYQQSLIHLTRIKGIVVLLFIACLGLTGWLFLSVPTGFLPEEDQGYSINILQGPEGTSLEYTEQVISQVDQEFLKIPEVASTFSIGGFGLIGGNIANNGRLFMDSRDLAKKAL